MVLGGAEPGMVARVDPHAGGDVAEFADIGMRDLVAAHRVAIVTQHRVGDITVGSDIGVAAEFAVADDRARVDFGLFGQRTLGRPGVDAVALIDAHGRNRYFRPPCGAMPPTSVPSPSPECR